MTLRIYFYFIFLLFFISNAFASPPYINGDPDTGQPCVTQNYLLATANYLSQTSILSIGGQTEYGLWENWQTHLYVPIVYYRNQATPSAVGLGDTEVSLKYRFLRIEKYLLDFAVEPMLELPTGDSYRNLGNGRLWSKLPLWFGKQWDNWLLTGGAGYVFNSAPDMKNFVFGGATLQYQVNEQLWIGSEIYYQNAASRELTAPNQDLGKATLMNVGATYNFSKSLALLLLAGHSISGTQQWYGTLGLNWAVG